MERPLIFNIYPEVIPLGNPIQHYRVAIRDESMDDAIYPFLARFDNEIEAEKYAKQIGYLLARFGGELRRQTLIPKNN